MIKLISAFTDENEVQANNTIETTAADSPISGRQMQIVECNGIPVYVDLKDRVCLPVEEGFNVL